MGGSEAKSRAEGYCGMVDPISSTRFRRLDARGGGTQGGDKISLCAFFGGELIAFWLHHQVCGGHLPLRSRVHSNVCELSACLEGGHAARARQRHPAVAPAASLGRCQEIERV